MTTFLHYGTYKVTQEQLENIIPHIKHCGIKNIDTAQLYRNEKHLNKSIHNWKYRCNVTTKFYPKSNNSTNVIKRSTSIFRNNEYIDKLTLLLHNPANSTAWLELEKEQYNIGVSNHQIKDLTRLFKYAKRYPNVNQIEFHPYVDNTELLKFCKEHNIHVVAHSIFLGGKCLNDHTIIDISKRNELTPAQVILLWCKSFGIDVCVNTAKPSHLYELVACVDKELEPSDIEQINQIHKRLTYRQYYKELYFKPEFQYMSQYETDSYAKIISNDFNRDMKSMSDYNDISNVCKYLPNPTNAKQRDLLSLALTTLGIDVVRYTKHYRELVEYKKKLDTDRKLVNNINKGLSCKFCIVKSHNREYSFDPIADPAPMPVEVSNRSLFEPIVAFLNSNEPIRDNTFIRGTTFADGRLDLCKQVVGSQSIKTICDATVNNQHVKHFLLGNNIAFADDAQVASEAFRHMIENQPHLETLYLAGNCIDSKSTKILCEALSNNKTCKYLWLKRNPIKAGVRYIADLLNTNHNIVLLDLNNCGICHHLSTFLSEITCDPKDFSLRYLYLDTNGLTDKCVVSLSGFIYKYNSLKSLSLSLNDLGSNGFSLLVHSLNRCQVLEHLNIESNGIDNFLAMSWLRLPSIKILSLSTNKNTFDMRVKKNYICTSNIHIIIRFIKRHPSLEFMSFRYVSLHDEDIQRLLTACESNEIICDIKTNLPNPRLDEYHKDPSKKQRIREIKHSSGVHYIDSIYRNKM